MRRLWCAAFAFATFCSSISLAQGSVQVSPNSIDLGPALVTCRFPCVFKTVTISNTGTSIVNFSGFSISGDPNDFFIGSNPSGPPTLPISVAPGQSVQIDVSFQPFVPGPLTANLVIQDDAGDSPQHVALQGFGVGLGDFAVDGTTGHNTATIHAGQTVQYAATFVASQTPGLLSYACNGLPPGSACSAGLGTNAPGIPSPLGLVAGGGVTSELDFYISTTAQGSSFSPLTGLWLLACFLLLAAGSLFLSAEKARRLVQATACLILLSTALSCGGHSASTATPPGTYNITFTLTIGSTSRSTNVTLIVQ